MEHRTGELSGGQMQRAAISRALVLGNIERIDSPRKPQPQATVADGG